MHEYPIKPTPIPSNVAFRDAIQARELSSCGSGCLISEREPSTDQLVIGLPELQVRSSNSAWAIAEVVGFRDISLDFDISKYSLLHHGATDYARINATARAFQLP